MKKKLLKKNPIENRKPYPIHITGLLIFFANSRFWKYIVNSQRTDLTLLYIASTVLGMIVLGYSLYKESEALSKVNKVLGVALILIGFYGIWMAVTTAM